MASSEEELTKLIKTDYVFPDQEDEDFQSKIYRKREFYYHKLPNRDEMTDYKDIKEYRDNICGRKFALYEHQALISNFMNPDTPYKGLIVFHGTGTGKCLAPESNVFVNGKLIPIEDIWEKYSTEKRITDSDGGEWCKPKTLDGGNLFVNSIDNKTFRGSIQPIKRLYRQYVTEKLVNIRLKNGSSIRITQAHKLLTENGWSTDFINNKYVAIPRKLVNKNIKSIGKDLAKFLSIQVTKAHEIDRLKCLIITDDYDNLVEYRQLFEKIAAIHNFKINDINIYSKDNDSHSLLVGCDDYIEFLSKDGYGWGKYEGIPNMLLNATVEEQEEFLQVFNDCDIETVSKNEIMQIQHLFKLVGKNMEIVTKYDTDTIYYGINKTEECKNDCIFVEIDSFSLEQYSGYVYDLEVEKIHSFVAEGLYVSNTCLAVNTAESFKSLITKYNTKIHILVSGPLLKESWKNSLVLCTGETYLKQQDDSVYVSQNDKDRAKKIAINNALQYYRFMSYRSFYKKVLGEKIRDSGEDKKAKKTYRKNKEGEYERDIAIDRIYNLDNTLLIIDEAHNLTGNAYGDALQKIIDNSTNLKVLLLTATPMKNLADDIVELVNFIRPKNEKISRDKIFNSYKNHQMNFKPGGIDYLKKMTKGYVSYLRGADPLTFAKRMDMGKIPKGLLFTKVSGCKMYEFQQGIYDRELLNVDDSLDRKSESVANFVIPGLSEDRKGLDGYFGRDGVNTIKTQLRTDYDKLNKAIADNIKGIQKYDEDYLYISDNQRTITGAIMKFNNLKFFSIKFYKALKKLNRLVWGKKGPRTAFVYSNLVKVGIELFQEILFQNGYLEYDENNANYKIRNDTRCYYCGNTYYDHRHGKLKIYETKEASASSSEYKKKTEEIPPHEFHPATFVTVTGKSEDATVDVIPEDKQRILDNVYSNIENREGKYIKFVLGSKVMNEGISLKNVAEVHILDVYFNLGRVDQVIGRAIRYCSHYKIINDEYRFPEVKVYKYAITMKNKITTEEELYRKAEKKYMLIKKVERSLKEIAFDCPLNKSGNSFPEELSHYQNCIPPNQPNPDNKIVCPAICDYMQCDFKCDETLLNEKYFDEEKKRYKKISREELDYTTFSNNLARNEINYAKNKIKEMYKITYVHALNEIIRYIKNSYSGEKRELFDEFFVFKALDEMIPITENDFNNFNDTIYDKYNNSGYLIYVNKYYIFQPFDQKEDVTMHYRSSYSKDLKSNLTLHNYIKSIPKYAEFKKKNTPKSDTQGDNSQNVYNFDDVMDYYDKRKEFKYVGIIDKESSRRKNKTPEELVDVFKIRERRSKILDKKRGTGIPNIKGAVCGTSKNKEYLENIAKHLSLKLEKNDKRTLICNIIRERLLFLEKYSSDKKNNKMTYMMIPKNHRVYPFPYNLEDRVQHIKAQIKDKIKFKIDMKINTKTIKVNKESVNNYEIIISASEKLKEFKQFFDSLGAIIVAGKYKIIIE